MITIIITATTHFSCAQELSQNDVPQKVVKAFSDKYPEAYDVEWEKKGRLYNVEFDYNHRELELWINEQGTIERTSEDLTQNDIPEIVYKTFMENHEGYRIEDIEKVTTNNKTVYKIEAEDEYDNEFTFVLDGKGRDVHY